LTPIRDNLSSVWELNIDFSKTKNDFRKNLYESNERIAYLTVPYEKDLNRIYYMNWKEGIDFVKWCQR
jgi:hypothetical protein